MPVIHIGLVTPEPDGSFSPARGFLTFTPTARRKIAGALAKVVLPEPVKVALSESATDVTLAATGAGWAWRVDEYVSPPWQTFYVSIPDVEAVDYADLPRLDPSTLEPGPALNPAWVLSQNMALAATPEVLMVGTITRDTYGAPLSAAVTWPDGVTGTFTGTPSATFPGVVDSYTLTHGADTYTQPLVTRNASGEITAKPAITLA
jgi:hypothetical protein